MGMWGGSMHVFSVGIVCRDDCARRPVQSEHAGGVLSILSFSMQGV